MALTAPNTLPLPARRRRAQIAPMSNPEVVGVLLAGGRATRMGGGDKCLLPLAGRPLLAHVIERMAPQVSALALNANGDPARFAGFGLPVVADTLPGFQGPLAGLLAGMRWAETRGATSIATAAADTPFFPRNYVERLLTASKPVAVARSGGRTHPLFSLVPVALAGDLEDFLGRQASRKVTDWLGLHAPAAIDLDGPADAPVDPFFNVNTAADLAKAEAVAQSLALRAT